MQNTLYHYILHPLRRGVIVVALLAGALLHEVSAAGLGNKTTVEAYETSVREAFGRGEWDKGLEILKESLALYPESSELNQLAGKYYYRLKEYDKARYFLVRAVKDTPDNTRAKQLLINVEEETGNYSSAICYVNELLEISPYWKGLWKRKIGLYRREGNNQEADRLLKRLFEIFPNDTTVRKDYLARLEENYLRERKQGDRRTAVTSLRTLLQTGGPNEAYYLELVNLLLQQGETDEALVTVAEGVTAFPCSSSLAAKRAEILAGLQRYPEALAFLEERMKACPTQNTLRELYHSILGDYARAQQNADPYRLYGRLYDLDKSREALEYLIDEAAQSGRREDLTRYLAEARQRYGDLPEWRFKEYDFYKRIGSPRADVLLEELYTRYPDNYDVVEEMCLLRYRQAEAWQADGAYREAARAFDFVADHVQEQEMKTAALRKSYSIYLLLNEFSLARRRLDTLRPYLSRDEYVVGQADILQHEGDTAAALNLMYRHIKASDSALDSSYMTSLYEESTLPYLKTLLENGNLHTAARESQRLLEICPTSKIGLQYALSSFSALGDTEQSQHYLRTGRERYPNELYFIEKEAAWFYDNQRYTEALALLSSPADSLPGNRTIVAAFSANSEAQTYALLKMQRPTEAMTCIDDALRRDPTNTSLLLAKGAVYEKQELYDSAYLYQSQYKPTFDEARDFRRRMIGLQRRGMAHELSMGTLFGNYLNGRSLAPVADLTYAYTHRKHRFFLNPSYTAREDVVEESGINIPGGQAVRLTAGWEGRLSPRWSALASVGWANDIFPTLSANASVTYAFNKEWTLGIGLGYRAINQEHVEYRWADPADGESVGQWVPQSYTRQNEPLFNAGLTAAKSYESLIMTLKSDLFVMNGSIYFNSSAQLKYLPTTDRTTYVRGIIGLGTAPELSLIDHAMPGSFSKLNLSAGIGAGYLIGKHMLLGVDALYSTLYSQSGIRTGSYDNYIDDIQTQYKNLLTVSLYVSFYF